MFVHRGFLAVAVFVRAMDCEAMNNQYSKAIISELGHVSYRAQSSYTIFDDFLKFTKP